MSPINQIGQCRPALITERYKLEIKISLLNIAIFHFQHRLDWDQSGSLCHGGTSCIYNAFNCKLINLMGHQMRWMWAKRKNCEGAVAKKLCGFGLFPFGAMENNEMEIAFGTSLRRATATFHSHAKKSEIFGEWPGGQWVCKLGVCMFYCHFRNSIQMSGDKMHLFIVRFVTDQLLSCTYHHHPHQHFHHCRPRSDKQTTKLPKSICFVRYQIRDRIDVSDGRNWIVVIARCSVRHYLPRIAYE